MSPILMTEHEMTACVKVCINCIYNIYLIVEYI